MKHITVFTLFSLLLAGIINLTMACSKYENQDLKPSEPQFELAWSDDFTGTQLDVSKWEYLNPGARRSAYNDASTVSVVNDNLIIQPYTVIENNAQKHYTGYIATKKRDFKYGRFEAKIAFVNEPASWSAFWVQSPTMGKLIGDPRTAGMELDIVESLPNDGRVHQNIHWDGYAADHKQTGIITADVGSNSGNYHIYLLEWTPDYYKFFVDGKLTWTYKDNVSQRGEYIILSTEIQNDFWTGKIPAAGYGKKGEGKTIMKVDYVKYYSLKK